MRLWFQETTVFLDFGFVSAQLQDFQTCAFAKASPKAKNPCCPSLHLFSQCSSFGIGPANIKRRNVEIGNADVESQGPEN
ncbi:MAG: hypothetical protein WCS94_11230 [Verrucomicrobiota bacterium]